MSRLSLRSALVVLVVVAGLALGLRSASAAAVSVSSVSCTPASSGAYVGGAAPVNCVGTVTAVGTATTLNLNALFTGNPSVSGVVLTDSTGGLISFTTAPGGGTITFDAVAGTVVTFQATLAFPTIGTYTVTVTDGAGHTSVQTITVVSQQFFYNSGVSNPVPMGTPCYGGNGTCHDGNTTPNA